MKDAFYLIEIKKVLLTGATLCFKVALLSGCASMSTTTSAKNMTRPVMVGPVLYVKSDKKTPLYKKQEFDIMVENSVVTAGGQFQTTTYITKETSEKIDAGLMRILETPKDKIVVENIYVKSARACFLGFLCSSEVDYSGIEGGIYSSAPVSKEGSK